MPKKMQKKVRKEIDQTLTQKSISSIISLHLSQFQRTYDIIPTNLSLEKLLTPSHTKPSRRNKFSLRSPNGFILYRKDIQQAIIENDSNATFEKISNIASERWKNESEEKKNFFNLLSKVAYLVYLDICEYYVRQDKERKKENIKIDICEMNRPWMQSSIFPTMLILPNSLHCKEATGDVLIESNQISDHSFYDNDVTQEVPSISSYNIDQSISHSTSSNFNPSFVSNANEGSASYHSNDHFHFQVLEIPYISDFPCQMPSHSYCVNECIMSLNYENNDNSYIFNDVNHQGSSLGFQENNDNSILYDVSGISDSTIDEASLN
ncbi:7635_t:CDS:1 [Funneliformis geosporum]|uniref:16879_t:CDS:1 n=1 Tax=Funneliformis geosporum TaxID=1117311 RepID=A0A9W4WKU1_9GLOM|nr:16879_t:CDS:1 [Funneliformis geosporum]CAI2161703.1 7635_t:CDS:1 [Funneliformis geosporum]